MFLERFFTNLEIVDSALDEGATVDGIVEVTNVDGPDGDANDGDELGELLAELVELLGKASSPARSRPLNRES